MNATGNHTFKEGGLIAMTKNNKYSATNSSLSAFSWSDIMLLCSNGGLDGAAENQLKKTMIQAFVDSHYPGKITQIGGNSKYKKDMWRARYYEDGKRKEFTCREKDDVYLKLYEYYKEKENSSRTLEAVFDMLKEYKTNQLNRSESTINNDESLFRELSEELRKSSIADISTDKISNWIRTEYLTRIPKESRFKKTMHLLDQIFEYGIGQKICATNPMKGISMDLYVKDCDITKKADEEKLFSEEEIDKLLDYAQKHADNPRALLMMFCCYTGIRVGEAVAIHIEDISDTFVHIHRQQVRGKDEGKITFTEVPYTKNERQHPNDGRYVPLLDDSKKVIELAKQIFGDSKYLFHDPDSDEMVTKDSYMKYLCRACKKLECQATNNHAFRIAFNSELIEMGFSSADRALILGQSVQTNEKYYSKSDKRRLEGIRSRMAAYEKEQEG